MKKIYINLENCFGIGKLEHEFNFNGCDSNSFIVYAPNGTMKTSFAKTFSLLSKKNSTDLPRDEVYPERISKYQINVDDELISMDSILVINAQDENYDTSNKISSFIASKGLKKRYDEIYRQLEDQKKEYLKKLKQVSQSSDCEVELINTFQESSSATFFEILLNLSDKMVQRPESYDFRYNDIFDRKGNVKKFLDKNQKILNDYVSKYDELLKTSKFFNGSDNSFGTYQANLLLKSTEDNSFFDAGHKFILNDDSEISSKDEFSNLLQHEISTIINDDDLKKSFDKVDRSIGANSELRAFKLALENNNLLLVKLENYELFRKELWINYVSLLSHETIELIELYKTKKDELKEIVKEAKKEFELWIEIIKKFNERFYVPFNVQIENQEDVILKSDAANLAFNYKDQNGDLVKKDKKELLSILSRGEKRAFFILQLLFDIESRKHLGQSTLIIFDDIADSFDYKNKYAIIEYIKDLHNNSLFKIILLTHNFDFYRTVSKRLDLSRKCILMSIKNEGRVINLKQGQYLYDIFKYFKNNLSSPKIFISLIPLTRNLIEYIKGKSSTEYNLLTSCLHIKNDTYDINCFTILELIHGLFQTTSNQSIAFGNEKISELIYSTADGIISEQNINEILLENKITLSIASRIKAEEHMISKLTEIETNQIEKNQTIELLKLFRGLEEEKESIETLEKVILMTPENIHVNAFMYEPLIDISIFHLIDLYKKVKSLN